MGYLKINMLSISGGEGGKQAHAEECKNFTAQEPVKYLTLFQMLRSDRSTDM